MKTIAFVLSASLLFLSSGSLAYAQEPDNFTSSVVVREGIPTRPPEPNPPGFTIEVRITNNGPEITDVILNVEIKSEAGEKVEQWFFENHPFERDVDQLLSWVPELPEQAGTYTVSVGAFSQNWTELLHWHEAAARFTQHADGTRTIHDDEEGSTPAELSIWWPSDGATINGTQPFKALLEEHSLDQYEMFWQVDEGQLNLMHNSQEDWPHKEAIVDLSGWSWRNSGPYMVNFVAQNNEGAVLAERAVSIHTEGKEEDDTVGDITICGRPGTQSFNACYYEGQNFETFKLQRNDGAQLDFDWGTGSPHAVVSSDNFSAKWRGLFDFEDGLYEFKVTTDDGFQLFVDNEMIIDEMHDQPATTYTVQKRMSEAQLRGVIAHYYENGGEAVAKLSWRKIAEE